MGVRVEFTDGTEKVYKKATGWTRNHLTGVYHVHRTKETKTKIQKSSFFSREVKTTENIDKKEITVAFIESHSVLLAEII